MCVRLIFGGAWVEEKPEGHLSAAHTHTDTPQNRTTRRTTQVARDAATRSQVVAGVVGKGGEKDGEMSFASALSLLYARPSGSKSYLTTRSKNACHLEPAAAKMRHSSR